MRKNLLMNRIVDFLMLLPFVVFPGYVLYGTAQTIFKIYSSIIYGIILVVYLKQRKFSIPKITILFIIMQAIPLMVTMTYGDTSQVDRAVKILLASVCAALLIDYNMKNRKKEFLESVIIFFGVLVIMNILSFYIYYPSMDPTQLYFYFLGNDNGSIYETFLFVYTAIIYFITYKNKIPLYFYIIMLFIFLGYFYVKSGNGMVCMLITLLFTISYKSKVMEKITNQKLLIIIYIFFFCMIVVFRNNNNFIMKTVLGILEKSSTFSGRTYIWDKCYYYFEKYPLFGNGYENLILSYSKIGNVKAHNVIIQYLYTGGVTMLMTFLGIMMLVLRKIKKSNINTNLKKCMNFSLFLFFIISMFDYYFTKYTFFIMLLIYYFIACSTKEENSRYE